MNVLKKASTTYGIALTSTLRLLERVRYKFFKFHTQLNFQVMNNTNDDNKNEKFYVSGFGDVPVEEAKKFIQRVAPLARTYHNTVVLRKTVVPREQERTKRLLTGIEDDIAINIIHQLLDLVGFKFRENDENLIFNP